MFFRRGFHPSSALYRFTLLIFVASLSFGSYFAYDIVAALSPTLVEQLSTSRGVVGSFFTFYHLAAILLKRSDAREGGDLERIGRS
ncbi:MAG: hypothetical protein PVI11_00750 [Candidatus Aminicenantes bacterium]